MSERLPDRVAIITGGASGVGEGGTRAFAEAGAVVVVADLSQERGSALARGLGETEVVPSRCAPTSPKAARWRA